MIKKIMKIIVDTPIIIILCPVAVFILIGRKSIRIANIIQNKISF